jgi:hypothetical protein
LFELFVGIPRPTGIKSEIMPRERYMSISNKLITLAAVFATATATTAMADSQWSKVTGFNPSVLEVASNGTAYTTLKQTGSTKMVANVSYNTGTFGYIQSWTVTPVIKTASNVAVGNLNAYTYIRAYGISNRPSSIVENVELNIPAVALEEKAVAMCNGKANALRAQGKSNKQIFSADHEVFFHASVDFDVDAHGAGSNYPDIQILSSHEIKVECKKWQGAQFNPAGVMAEALTVKKATTTLKEYATLGGVCKVLLTTEITANMPNATIKYRFVHSSGKKSAIFSEKTWFDMRKVVSYIFPVPNGAGPEVGMMWMEGVSPKFKSNKASYNMSCTDRPGGLTQNPARPGPKLRAK